MGLQNIVSSAGHKMSRFAGRAGLSIRKNSPEILMGTGIVGIVITVVTACKATLSSEEVLEHHAEKMKKIHEAEKYQDEEYPFPPAVAAKEKTVAYIQTGGEFVKLYAPTITIGSLSVACILASNHIIKRRYLGAVAAYNALSVSYEQYRSRVRERYGDDVDYEMRYGVKREKIEAVDENGKKLKKKETVEVIDEMPSDAARVWGKYLKDGVLNPNWDENPEFNMSFLKAVQETANHILHAKGYIFLNEVYDMLGFEGSQLGQIVGWLDEGFDGCVDFGLYNLNNRDTRRFINGDENCILLDFNHDGVIWDKI